RGIVESRALVSRIHSWRSAIMEATLGDRGRCHEEAGGRVAPGPPGEPLIGHLRPFGRDALSFLIGLAREYGGVARFRLGPKLVHLVSDPAGVEHVLQDNYKNYGKGKPYARARFAFGEGLIT